MKQEMHVCSHTDVNQSAFNSCEVPFAVVMKPTNDKFNKFTNNISHIEIADTASDEILNAFVAAMK